MALAHLPFLLKAKKVDSIAANGFRALGARPIGMLYPRRGVAGHLAFGIDSIASIGLMGTL